MHDLIAVSRRASKAARDLNPDGEGDRRRLHMERTHEA